MSIDETVQAPNFHITIAKANKETTTKTKDGLEVKFFSGTRNDPPFLSDKKLSQFNEELNAHVTELIIHETMQAADSFTIKMIDPDMSFMFGENLFIGRYIFISIGLGKSEVRKIDGFINSMQYEFPSNGLPVLVIEGYGTVWDVLSKDSHIWKVKISDDPWWAGKDGPIRKGGGDPAFWCAEYLSLRELFNAIQQRFDLEPIDWGRTIPADIDRKIYLTIDETLEGTPREFKGIPCGKMSTWEFLGKLADNMGCIFFMKGREMHFYPAAWIDAPVDFDKRAAEKKSAILEKIKKTPNLFEKAKLIAQSKALEQSISEIVKRSSMQADEARVGKTFWYKMDNQIPGLEGTGYNLLSFKPELQNLQVGGYFGMAMDPKSGRITFGTATEDKNLGAIQTATPAQGTTGLNAESGTFIAEKPKPQGQVALLNEKKKTPPATVKTPTPPGTSASPKPKPSLLDKIKSAAKDKLKELVQKVLPAGVGSVLTSAVENKYTPGKQGVRVMQPEAGKSSEEMDGLAAASYRKWMWFATAQAEVVGDPHLTVAMPAWIYGFGTPKQLQQGLHNEKICGKWYVFGVTHRITTGKAYLCELELKRFWQWAQPINPSDESHADTGKGPKIDLTIDKPFGTKVNVLDKVSK
jgi:hypothetical protein